MPSTKQTTHDNTFYFSYVTFRVENTLFRVPRHELEHTSRVFRDMFLIPSGTDHPEGASDEHPIVLENTSSYDFRQLLRAMLCGNDRGSTAETQPTTFKEWCSVIKLAHRWEMSTLYDLALKKADDMGNIDPVEKAAFAFKYDIQTWLLRALNDIARRAEPLSQRDVDILGLDTVLKLARVRESITTRGNVGPRTAERSQSSTSEPYGSVVADQGR